MEQLNRLICIIVSITLFSQLTNAGIQNEGDSAGIQNQEDNGAKTLTIEKLDKDTLSNKENEPAKKETAPFLINVKNTMNSKPIKIITRGSKAVGNGIRQFGSNVADRLNENHRKYSIEVSPKSKVPAAIRHNLIEPTVAASQVTAEKTKKFYESKLGKNGKSEASSSSSSEEEEEEEEEEKKKGEEGEKKSKKKEKKHKEHEKNDEEQEKNGEEQEKKSKKKEKNGEEELIKKEEEISKKPKITVGGISSTARNYGTALKHATGSTVNKVYGKIKGDGTQNDSEDTADPTLNEKKMKEKKEKKKKKKGKKGKKEGKENKEKKEKKKQRKDEVSGEAV